MSASDRGWQAGAGGGLDALTAVKAQLTSLFIDAVEEYAIFALDPDGVVMTWNAGAHRIKGYTAEEILGRHFSAFYPVEDVRAGKPERQLTQARDHGHSRDEGWRVRQDGSRFWANVTITAVHDADGVLTGFVKITRDDTDRRRVEEQARQLELLSERERIAHEMHEAVIDRIFAASETMAGALTLTHNTVAAERIRAAITMLDDTVREIRTIVLDPHTAE